MKRPNQISQRMKRLLRNMSWGREGNIPVSYYGALGIALERGWASLDDEGGYGLTRLGRKVAISVGGHPVISYDDIVQDANDLAAEFARANEWSFAKDYKFYEAPHDRQRSFWQLAVIAYEHITGRDAEDALRAIQDGEHDQ